MALEVVVPKLGMTMEEATLVRWLVADGSQVRKGDLIFEAESEKISFEGEAEGDGVLRHAVAEGSTVVAGGTLAFILADGEPIPAVVTSASVAERTVDAPRIVPSRRDDGRIAASPVARRLAGELGVDLSTVVGTGPNGRIVEADVRAAAAAATGPAVHRRVAMTGMRKTIAARMTESQRTSAQFTLHLTVDITKATSLRRHSDTRFSVTDVVIKACATAIAKHGRCNAWIQGDEIIEFSDVNIGFAVALDEGLVVPVIPKVQDLDVATIAQRRESLAKEARDATLTMDDFENGTFTVSVLGLVDGFTPIINPPQVAILGVGRTVQRPAVWDGSIVPRWQMTLSLTVDHRAIDGEPAARFLRDIGKAIEHPETLVAEARTGDA